MVSGINPENPITPCTKPYQRIIFKTEVQQVNIKFKDTIDDREFWKDQSMFKKSQNRTYSRLKLIEGIKSEMLKLNKLLENGLKTAPQGPLRANDRLETYIISAFKHAYSLNNDDFNLPEELVASQGETYSEGAKKQVLINAYERNPIARNKCILIHGSKCVICGFDFGDYYGSEF